MAEPDVKPENDNNWEQVELASFGQRVGTFLLDIMFLFVLTSIVEAVLVLLGYGNHFKEVNPDSLGLMSTNRPLLIERTLVMICYYLIQEWLTGRTMGKLIMGTQAINNDGSDLTLGRAIGRTLCRFIPFEFFSFFLQHEDGVKGWHDRIPKTLVINLRKTPKPASNAWQS